MTPEQRKALREQWRSMTPEQRKQWVEQNRPEGG
jgi:TRAP-type C4-dicarboxylate transport system substrate-binding protein